MLTKNDHETIVFDLDGTLIDTLPDLDAALVAALTTCGWAVPPADVRQGSVNLGMAGMVAAVGALQAEAAASQAQVLSEFLRCYEQRIFADSALYPGVPQTLQRLREGGRRLAVCTNKTEALSRRLLAHAGLLGYFDAVIGGDTTAEAKPSALPLRAAIAACGGQPGGAILVGDSEIDAACGANAGVPVFLLDHGYAVERSLYRHHPRVFGGFAALGDALLAPGRAAPAGVPANLGEA